MYLCEICECMEIKKKRKKENTMLWSQEGKMLFFLLFLNYFLNIDPLCQITWQKYCELYSSNCIEIVKIHDVLLSVLRCVCTCTSLEAKVLIIKNTQRETT